MVTSLFWSDMLTEDNHGCFSICFGLIYWQKTIMAILAFVQIWYVTRRQSCLL